MNTLLKSNKDGGDSSTMRQHLNELHEFVDRLDLSSGQRSTLEALVSFLTSCLGELKCVVSKRIFF